MVVKRYLPIAAAAAIACAACSSSSASSLSASQLAHKISGCAAFTTDTPASIETAEATCTLADGSLVTIGTFPTSGAEQQWIQDGGSTLSPDPAFAGCCIQGSGWAATVGLNNAGTPLEPDYQAVLSAIGGRQVNG